MSRAARSGFVGRPQQVAANSCCFQPLRLVARLIAALALALAAAGAGAEPQERSLKTPRTPWGDLSAEELTAVRLIVLSVILMRLVRRKQISVQIACLVV